MRKFTTTYCVTLFLFVSNGLYAQSIPTPQHVLILFEENHAFEQIIGDTIDAPYINSLVKDTDGALFTDYYALIHPSQPNYLMLFSGFDQNVNGDDITTSQFTDCNLGASLISNGYTFVGYSEDEPSVGYLGDDYLDYYRKHNPWSNWQGSSQNAIPDSSNASYDFFPSNYALLPTLCYVMPDIVDDMHSGTINAADVWLRNNLSNYITWAKSHNSLFVLLWDEDDNDHNNHIPAILVGQMVKAGQYSTYANNYHMLRTFEAMYNLSYCANSDTVSAITGCWKNNSTGINNQSSSNEQLSIYPNPTNGLITITSTKNIDAITVTNLLGQTMLKSPLGDLGVTRKEIDLSCFSAGMYFITVSQGNTTETRKIIVNR